MALLRLGEYKIMKVFLLNPPASNRVAVVREGRCMQRKGAWTAVWSPLSLALCAAVLEQEGFEVSILDCTVKDVTPEQLMNQINSLNPDLVVLNVTTPSIESDLKMVNMIKQACPETKTAVIGIHSTALPNECFNACEGLDCIIRGEPERTLRELCKAIASAKGDNFQANLQDIEGISFRDGDKIIHNLPRPWLEMDELPFPAWHLIDTSDYIMPFHNLPFLLVATSRGCPYSCTFCADSTYYGRKLRRRSPKQLVDELQWAGKEFGIHEFLFWAESFTLDRSFVMAVCDEIIKRQLSISWVCNSRVDHVDMELLQAIKKAGCWMIGYGIESGNQAVLDSVKKGITVEQIKKAVELSHQAGLDVSGHCVLGLPLDTIQTIKQTIEFTISLDLDFVQFYCAVPFPGSSMYKQACQNHWINTTDWSMFEQNFSVLDYPHITAKEIMNLRRRAYRRFYLRPRMILKVLKRLKKLADFKVFFQMIREFMTWV